MSIKQRPLQSPLLINGGPNPIRIDWIPIEFVKKNPRNARTHSKKQIEKLAKAIQATGFMNPIVTDKNLMCLAGHGRLDAAAGLGMTNVPVIKVTHFSDAQKIIFALADNKIAEEAAWDREQLAIELAELIDILPAEDLEVSVTGFETAEVDLLFADMHRSATVSEAEPPSLPKHPVTKFGEKWHLGRHTLLCGDARDPAAFATVTNGKPVAVTFCDPPYNRPASAIGGRGRHKHGAFAFGSGEMSADDYRDFLQATLRNGFQVSKLGALAYVFIDWRHVADLIAAATATESVEMLNLVVWVKTNPGQGSFYRSAHELIGVFRIGEEAHRNNVQLGSFGRNRSNVWSYPGCTSFGQGRLEALEAHPTVKPVALIADALLDCTVHNDLVLDQFCGSGSSILAAEKVGRTACGIEYEPAYVDVAVKRWQELTKRDATLTSDGRTFDEIAAERSKSPPVNEERRDSSGTSSSARIARKSRSNGRRKGGAHE